MNARLSLLVMVFLVGCAGMATDVDSLRAKGYDPIKGYFITATGERREQSMAEMWVRENRGSGRTVSLCMVPKVMVGGYNWRVVVYVDNKETWSYQSGALSGNPSMRHATDCTESAPLPEGRLDYQTWYSYWN